MQQTRRIISSLAAGLFAAGCVQAETQDTQGASEAVSTPAAQAVVLGPDTLVSVNGVPVDLFSFNLFLRERFNIKPGKEVPQKLQSAALNELVNVLILAEAAEKSGLTLRPEVISALQLQRRESLARIVAAGYAASHQPSDAEIETLYKERVSGEPLMEYKARHILVSSEDEAKGIIEELNKGADFAEVAKTRSADKGSGASGGDLGWFNAKRMVKPFSDAVAAMEKGTISKAPVKSQFGWHVIKLEDTRQSEAPTLEQLRPKLVAQLKQRALAKHLTELQSQADIKYNENLLKVGQAAQPSDVSKGQEDTAK